MYALLLIIHLLICLSLIGVVLIQSGKGGGLAGGAFGGSAQTVFGGRGATDVVTRATMILGGMFFVTSLVLALMTTGQRGPSRSLIQEAARKAATTQQQPAQTPSGTSPTAAPPTGTNPSTAPPARTAPAPAKPPSSTSKPGGGK